MPTLTCLLVDDDIDDQEIFKLALKHLPYAVQCITADDGMDALDQLNADQSFVPDYIFLDLNMPRMDGFQTLVAIKQLARLADVPVIIYTTSAEQRDMHRSKELGCYRFITKPISINDLKTILTDVFWGSKPLVTQ